jgi:DNA-nicking Smr family endonuclease
MMDMGDILDQWDTYQKDQKKKQREGVKTNQTSGVKAPQTSGTAKASQSKADNSKQINPMELWLRRYGTIDKDKIAEEQEERSKLFDRGYLLNMAPEARLDLHGLHQDEAQASLDRFITDCKARGLRKVLIIHGKGIHSHGSDPVLGELVRRFIEQDKRCGASGHPKTKAEGGSGATWVLLK